jgi:hypothetical protein
MFLKYQSIPLMSATSATKPRTPKKSKRISLAADSSGKLIGNNVDRFMVAYHQLFFRKLEQINE